MKNGRILLLITYGLLTLFGLCIAGSLLMLGLVLKEKESMLARFAVEGNLPHNVAIIEDIKRFKNKTPVYYFKKMQVLHTYELDVVLCAAYAGEHETEQALVACTEAIEDGKALGVDVRPLIYNRAIVHIGSAFERSGAFSYAEEDLRHVPEVANSKALLEAIYLLLASKKMQEAEKRQDGSSEDKTPPLFNDNPSPGQDSGF